MSVGAVVCWVGFVYGADMFATLILIDGFRSIECGGGALLDCFDDVGFDSVV